MSFAVSKIYAIAPRSTYGEEIKSGVLIGFTERNDYEGL
jgi:hypothetical protein